jgi:hypothetical protein
MHTCILLNNFLSRRLLAKEGWAFSCILQMTFKESHIPGMPHSNNISQLGTGLSKVLWVAGYRLWSSRLHMWRVHDGFPLPMKFFFKSELYFGVILGIFQSQICWLKSWWDLKLILFCFTWMRDRISWEWDGIWWTNFHPWNRVEHKIIWR